MDKQPVMVEIEDLREFVGGASELNVEEQQRSGPEPSYPGMINGTSMCWHSAQAPDASEDWIVIKGK